MSFPRPQEFLVGSSLFPPGVQVPSEFTDEPTNDRGQTGAQGGMPVSSGQDKAEIVLQVLGGAD